MDSVPNGGWLDGCLNVLAGVEILRRLAAQYDGVPPVTVRLVDWADEEGARFGKSLFGSSACSGNLDMDEARALVDKAGITLPDALKNVGIDFEKVKDSHSELANAVAYLELHIEQGPVLLDLDLPLGVVLGTFGVERHAINFHGQAAHSGSTPMNRRKDAFLAAAKMSPEIYEIAARHGGVCTIGSCTTKPGIVTSVVEDCRITLDQRNLDAKGLAGLYADARAASERFAKQCNVTVSWERLWSIEPVLFDHYIAVDPSVWWNEQHLVRTELHRLAWLTGTTSLYLANSDEGDAEGLAILTHALTSYAPPVAWTFEPMPDEHHGTIYPHAALRGIRKIFAND